MRVVLFGQKWLATEVLLRLLDIPRIEVIGVCPDTETDRLVALAEQKQLPLVSMDGVPSCDMAVAAYCQRYIPASVRERCGLGVLAYHPSLLPRHRGRDAVRWTIHMRDPIAGGTVYWMDDSADTGPIEAQDWCHVLPSDDAASLWRRSLAPMGVTLLTDAVTRLSAGEMPRAIPQDTLAATWEPSFNKQRLS